MGKRQQRRTSLVSVQAMHVGNRTVIWLRGDIDIALERRLMDVAESIPPTTSEVVIDVARTRFSDLSLARFVESLAHKVCVTVRYPTRRSRELLRLTGVDALVQIEASAFHAQTAPDEVRDVSRDRRESLSSGRTDQLMPS
jgi:hypothetical protein